MSELADACRTPRTICPGCGAARYHVSNTYYLGDGTKKRLRKCFQCGHAETETPPPEKPKENTTPEV